jgi:hypothetical protein
MSCWLNLASQGIESILLEKFKEYADVFSGMCHKTTGYKLFSIN